MSVILEGKFAVITGAASVNGLGKATARLFAQHGATVAILDLNLESAQAAAAICFGLFVAGSSLLLPN